MRIRVLAIASVLFRLHGLRESLLNQRTRHSHRSVSLGFQGCNWSLDPTRLSGRAGKKTEPTKTLNTPAERQATLTICIEKTTQRQDFPVTPD
jgi:hypothetical protein